MRRLAFAFEHEGILLPFLVVMSEQQILSGGGDKDAFEAALNRLFEERAIVFSDDIHREQMTSVGFGEVYEDNHFEFFKHSVPEEWREPLIKLLSRPDIEVIGEGFEPVDTP